MRLILAFEFGLWKLNAQPEIQILKKDFSWIFFKSTEMTFLLHSYELKYGGVVHSHMVGNQLCCSEYPIIVQKLFQFFFLSYECKASQIKFSFYWNKQEVAYNQTFMQMGNILLI